VRSVFAFPTLPRADVEACLDRIGQRSDGIPGHRGWIIDRRLWVRVQTDDEGLYADWDADALAALRRAVGSRPRYAVIADVSGRIPGYREVASFLQVVIGRGGHARDDYTDDFWTYEQIAADRRTADGRLFFHNAAT
jgi:hypothetical protein